MTSKEIEELAGHRPVSAWVIKLVNDAIAIEREACAKVCESVEMFCDEYDPCYGAEMIRARGNNDV
ncbi:hypothetical protein UFOVP684_21 [uncultured Caudovirales phage]|uniref:Uncharacterized protein n=1 Tax=uncultured Caudovirales phage TaxID=2100421 RepID=A0A6J5M3N2_9CAUD|nr:hypothetical protein UFOVP409_14 [uncultured Caudovirales phage]CAB4157407.1 hypothetical protein UFOVP684_21 [uncultured Caudovirales phage]